MKKKNLLIVLLSLFGLTTQAQEGVEKSVFGVQGGFLGAWVHHEARLANQFALRTEIGIDAIFFMITPFSESATYTFAPEITIEPRYYYNLRKRSEKQKDTSANAANFISLKTTYTPDWFVISNSRYFVLVPNQISIIPTWGIRRSIGNSNFNYELGFGLGYQHAFYQHGYDEGDVAVNLHARIGYRF